MLYFTPQVDFKKTIIVIISKTGLMCGGSETGAVTGDVLLALWQKIRGPRGGRLFGGPVHFGL